MIHLGRRRYPYLEEINEGLLRHCSAPPAGGGRVLDVGCGRAALGEAIRQRGWEVWGIERDPEACATARQRLDQLVEADLLSQDQLDRQLGSARFDAVVLSDVLEHLYDPRTVLEQYLRYLKPGGRVLVSVPNAVVWTNRLQWLLGRVNYRDTGVMDRTHIRFFTFRTARQLVEATGCRVVTIDLTPHLVRAALPGLKRCLRLQAETEAHDPRALLDSRGYRLYQRFVYPGERLLARLWRTLLAFRIIIVAEKPPEDPDRVERSLS